MDNLEILASLKKTYNNITDIYENTRYFDFIEFESITNLLEKKYNECFKTIEKETPTFLRIIDFNVTIGSEIYDDYINEYGFLITAGDINYYWWENI